MTEDTKEQVIQVDPDDPISTIREKIIWAESPRVVLVVPYRNRAMRDKMNLKLVQRTAIDEAINVALVAYHQDTAKLAREIGLPVFWTKQGLLGGHNWNGAAEPQFVPGEQDGDLKVVAPLEPRISRNYRIAGAIALGTLIMVIAAATVLLVPTAKITLYPVSEMTSAKVQITASGSQKTINTLLAQIPATFSDIAIEGSEEVTPANKKDVPDGRAGGVVVFTSKADQAIKIPKGTIVSTSAGVPVRFATQADSEVPARGRVEGNVTAVDPGPGGNVARFTVNTVEGPFALALNVVNSNNLTGGTVKRVPVVDEADKQRAADALVQRLRQDALTRYRSALKEGEFVAPESVTVTLDTRTFDHLVDEPADVLRLSGTGTARGLIVNGADANIVALDRLKSTVRNGFELLPDTIEFVPGGLTGTTADSVRFELTAKGQMATSIDRSAVTTGVRGLNVSEAAAWLRKNFMLRRDSEIELRSDIFNMGRMPYFAFRIQIDVAP